MRELRLRDDLNAVEAIFVPEAGMLCRSLRSRRRQLLAQGEGVQAYARRGKTMGIPLLYPWANRLAGDGYEFAGRVARVPDDPSLVARDGGGLPIHGAIGGRMRWSIERSGGYERGLAASLAWTAADSELFALFPFEHALRYEATLSEARLTIAVTVSATGADPVPLAFGFHPYLTVPKTDRADWQIELPAMRGLELDERQLPTGAGAVRATGGFALAERTFDDGFDSLAEPSRFSLAAGGVRLTAEFEQGYPCAQVYTPPDAEFICFEPMCAPTNALCSGEGLRAVAPGERATARFSIAVGEASP